MTYRVLSKNRFQSGIYVIEPLRLDNMEHIRTWRNAQIAVLRQKRPLTSEDQVRYFDQVVSPLFAEERPVQMLFGLYCSDDFIGYGGLVHMSWLDQRAEMSFLVDPERAKDDEIYREDFSHFIALMQQLCFEELDFNRLFTETYDFRVKHMRILESCGMEREGLLRQHVFTNDRFCDSIFHAILKERYFA
ncbi:MAG: GNAT family N-acetyltransferase [Bacteroidota bacterium]